MKVLDASAILAHVLDEPGGNAALDHFPEGVVSAVNLSEVVARLVRDGVPEAIAIGQVAGYEFNVRAATQTQAEAAGALASHKPLSLGDRFCIALARELNLPVVTADRIWASLGLPVPVELIR
jgi:ribonuclease VapC